MPAIAFDRVTALRQRVFELRESTADEASEPFSIAELIDATQATRAVIRSILRALPDGAFDRQPDDTDGNDVWSAGQVVSHICEARVRFDHYGVLRRLAGLPEAPPSEAWPEYIGGPKLLSRAQSLKRSTCSKRNTTTSQTAFQMMSIWPRESSSSPSVRWDFGAS